MRKNSLHLHVCSRLTNNLCAKLMAVQYLANDATSHACTWPRAHVQYVTVHSLETIKGKVNVKRIAPGAPLPNLDEFGENDYWCVSFVCALLMVLRLASG